MIVLTGVLAASLNAGNIRVSAASGLRYPTGDYVEVPMPEIKELEPEVIEGMRPMALNAPNLNMDVSTGTHYRYLNDFEKKLYRAMVAAGSYVYDYGTEEVDKTDDGVVYIYSGEKKHNYLTSDQYQNVHEAVRSDHPDMLQFNLSTIKMRYGQVTYKSGETSESLKYAYLYMISTDAAYDQNTYNRMNAELRQAREQILADDSIRNAGGILEKELAIHDKLIEVNTYDDVCKNANTPYHVGHTAYGSLVKGTSVCDGYALALSYILAGEGINSMMIAGYAGGGHAWNIVELEGDWYEVDATWDDQDDAEFDYLTHNYYNLTTEQIESGGRYRIYYTEFLPVAYGTRYSYENVRAIIAEGDDSNAIPVTSLSLTPDQIIGKKNDSGSFNLEITPVDATTQNYIWESSDDSVVQVDQQGNYELLSEGSAKITVYSSDGKVSAEAEVIVRDESNVIYTREIVLSDTNLKLEYADTGIITYNVKPQTATNTKVKWANDNSNIVKLTDLGDNRVKYEIVGFGKTVITAKSADGKSESSCVISVPEIFVNVSFDANGGTGISESPVSMHLHMDYNLPAGINKEGYDFDGWYTEPTGGTLVTATTPVSIREDHVLYAHWKKKNYNVIYYATNGTINGMSQYLTTVKHGDSVDVTKVIPVRSGCTFDGWYTQSSGGERKTVISGITENIALYAHWTAIPVEEKIADSGDDNSSGAGSSSESSNTGSNSGSSGAGSSSNSSGQGQNGASNANDNSAQAESGNKVNDAADSSASGDNTAQEEKSEGNNTSGKSTSESDTSQNISSKGTNYSVSEEKTVTLVSADNKKVKTVTIKNSVTYNGITYKITRISSSAYKNNKKLQKLTIGSNVEVIGKNAFNGCKSLKNITIKANNLKKVESGSFKNINKKAKITIICRNKKQFNKVVKMMKKAGAKKARYVFKRG